MKCTLNLNNCRLIQSAIVGVVTVAILFESVNGQVHYHIENPNYPTTPMNPTYIISTATASGVSLNVSSGTKLG
jgi:hypothetical protein